MPVLFIFLETILRDLWTKHSDYHGTQIRPYRYTWFQYSKLKGPGNNHSCAELDIHKSSNTMPNSYCTSLLAVNPSDEHMVAWNFSCSIKPVKEGDDASVGLKPHVVAD